jgi:hypothetical protein
LRRDNLGRDKVGRDYREGKKRWRENLGRDESERFNICRKGK